MTDVTITVDSDTVADLQSTIYTALLAAEAVNPGSPELTVLHAGLSDLQDLYNGALPEVHKGTFQPMSGGDKPPIKSKP